MQDLVEYITLNSTNKVAWNSWHGSFTWIDDFAYDLLDHCYSDFDGNDWEEMMKQLRGLRVPIGNLRAV